MRTDAMALAYIEQARSRLRTAKLALKGGDHPFTVRQSQECVELSLKAALRIYGIEYPKEHDVRELLLEVRERFPRWFAEQVEKFGEISSRLARDRGPSMYGDEERGIPPSELFDREKARAALADAEFVHHACRKLLKEFLHKSARSSAAPSRHKRGR
jgi:HEPN domain-containing protein